jgi:hypothetical protein
MMFYSDHEYQVVASLLAQAELSDVDLRLHWLGGVGEERLEVLRESFGVQGKDMEADEVFELIPLLADVRDFAADLGMVVDLVDTEVKVEGDPHRVILLSLGPTQELFMPDRIGYGEGQRPVAIGDYALMVNRSGHLVNLYQGYPAFFYNVERTLKFMEVDVNREKTIYRNRSLAESLPRLRDIPLIGRLRLGAQEGDRVDLLISIDGKSLRFFAPALCVVEIWADTESELVQTFLTR